MIAVEELRFAYQGSGGRSLSGVSFEVDAGETVALMGHNGAGKTTLLKLVAGLESPDGGTVEIGEEAVVGFAPENPASGLFAESVREEVAFFPRNRGLDVEERVEAAMGAMDVAALADRSPFSLSVGEQRRVSIASVLAGDPAILALDEPTAGLDALAERELGDLLSGLDRTVLFATHETDFAYRVADTGAVLADGELLRFGDVRDLLADGELLEAAGVRPPGIVTWARRRGVEPPASLEAAVELVRGAREP